MIHLQMKKLRHIEMNSRKYRNLILLLINTILTVSQLEAGTTQGEIRGQFFEDGAPCSLRINIHNAATGLYFGYIETDSDGSFTFSNLPYGKYYLITHPAGVGVRMPLQWKTVDLEINNKKPQFNVRSVDGFAVKILHPQDGKVIDLEKVSAENPLEFSWKPYDCEANYEVEIYSTDKSQFFNTGRISTSKYSFDGIFQDGSQFKKRLYRWELKVFPKGAEWIGTSKPHDLVIGDFGTINRYEGEYIQLDFPKWYESTIDTLDLIQLLDICYLLEKELAAGQVPSLGPLPGEKQAFVYDPTITFAYSGNPIHFGKNHITENSFPLFLTFHEMGHNFQFGGLPGFAHLLGGDYYSRNPIFFGFSEGLAILASLYITETINKENLKPVVKNMFEAERKSMQEKFGAALDYYEEHQPNKKHITPDIIDGICIRLGDYYGWDMFPVFFRIFLKNDINDQIYQLAGDDDTKRTTIFVTAFSVAAGNDLYKQFKEWDFPVDDGYFQMIQPLVEKSLQIK